MKKYIATIIFFLMFTSCYGQPMALSLLAKDTFNKVTPFFLNFPYTQINDTATYTPAPKINIDSSFLKKWAYHWILYYDFYTTLTGLHYLNKQNSSDVNNLYFYYNIDIKSNLEFRNVKWDFYLFNDYGLRHYFDSLTLKTQDQFTLKNSLYYPIYRRRLYLSLTANTKTKLFNTYQYRENDVGKQERYLYDGFMSPGIIYYSGGLTYEAGGNSIVQLGLGSSKVTKIKNQEIFETRETKKISGLEKGERKKSEIGLTLTSTVPLQHISKHLHWEFFGNTFAPIKSLHDINAYTLEFNNVFHIILLKYVRFSWRTQVNYNQAQQPKPGIQNQISLGFYLSNHI